MVKNVIFDDGEYITRDTTGNHVIVDQTMGMVLGSTISCDELLRRMPQLRGHIAITEELF